MHVSDSHCAEIDVAPEVVCLSFNARAARAPGDYLAALALEDNQ